MYPLLLTVIATTIFFPMAGCSQKSPRAKPHMCAHKDDPTMGSYVVVFKGVTRGFVRQIAEEIDGKFFELADKGNITVVKPKSGAHGFTVVEQDPVGTCIIEVTPVKAKGSDMSVHIQMSKKEQGTSRRIFNPGNFNLTKMMAATKTKDPAPLLADLLVKLTFK